MKQGTMEHAETAVSGVLAVGAEDYFCSMQMDAGGGCQQLSSGVLPEGTSLHYLIEPHTDGDLLKVQLQQNSQSAIASGKIDISKVHLFVRRSEQTVLRCNDTDWVSAASGCWLNLRDVSASEEVTVYEASAQIYRTPAAIGKAWSSFSEDVQKSSFQGVKGASSSFVGWLKDKYQHVSKGAAQLGGRVYGHSEEKKQQLADNKAGQSSEKATQTVKDLRRQASKKIQDSKEENYDAIN